MGIEENKKIAKEFTERMGRGDSSALDDLATDDYIRINKPILTSRELSVVLGEISWDQFIKPKSSEHFLTIEEFE